MKFFIVAASAVAFLSSSVQGDCFGGSNARPQFPIDFVEHTAIAGFAIEGKGPMESGKEFSYNGKTRDGVCVGLLVKNKSGDTKWVAREQAMDAWMREWIGCEHGGERQYDDKLEYVFHMDC
ncbi:hypothetical protein AK830_g4360 [Neonectria ditissima]|uniref:Ecp2 effector protein domain-containing protein n=1 Tax=Neonectria ditissima TaxID=78410 RepID=A0A0N8H7M9_9HYPO|nr:hypothetical protein AK830_g4360 [Neonectria ditissima]